jgi:ubiquinone biosynthesis accessory factor UbiK
MLNPKMLDEMSKKMGEILAQSPVKDIEKNARALLGSLFSRLDLITREEFDVQQEVLKRARDKLAEMEKRVAELEAALLRKNNRQD